MSERLNLPRITEDEEWRDVPGYEGLYLISSNGRLWSNLSGRILKPAMNYKGYLHYFLCKGNDRRWFGAHRLVALAFIENPDNKPTVNHLNENKADNRVSNLEWATFHEQNIYGTRCQRVAEKTPMKPIVKMSKDGDEIEVFESISAAAREENIQPANIVKCLKGRRKSCGGFKWKYA